MPFTLLHIVHVILMRTPFEMVGIAADFVVALVPSDAPVRLFACGQHQHAHVGWPLYTIGGEVRSTVFGIERSGPGPALLRVAASHINGFEYLFQP